MQTLNNRVGFEIARDDFLDEHKDEYEKDPLKLVSEPYVNDNCRWCQGHSQTQLNMRKLWEVA